MSVSLTLFPTRRLYFFIRVNFSNGEVMASIFLRERRMCGIFIKTPLVYNAHPHNKKVFLLFYVFLWFLWDFVYFYVFVGLVVGHVNEGVNDVVKVIGRCADTAGA